MQTRRVFLDTEEPRRAAREDVLVLLREALTPLDGLDAPGDDIRVEKVIEPRSEVRLDPKRHVERRHAEEMFEQCVMTTPIDVLVLQLEFRDSPIINMTSHGRECSHPASGEKTSVPL